MGLMDKAIKAKPSQSVKQPNSSLTEELMYKMGLIDEYNEYEESEPEVKVRTKIKYKERNLELCLRLTCLTIVVHEEQGTRWQNFYYSDDKDIKSKIDEMKEKLRNDFGGYFIRNASCFGDLEFSPREFHQLLDWECDELIAAQKNFRR